MATQLFIPRIKVSLSTTNAAAKPLIAHISTSHLFVQDLVCRRCASGLLSREKQRGSQAASCLKKGKGSRQVSEHQEGLETHIEMERESQA